MRRLILCALTAAMMGGCFYHEPEYARYYDNDHREYRHARWHDEDVWRREDGRWYSRRGNDWILRADVDIH
ncbi:MAG TPA: hypothetical protein VLW85_05970 [Myxococcales bacterium]|nr:hypothetical protein [Myxococcales bacterium]